MQMRPAGEACDDAREWVKAYLEALVRASVLKDTAGSAAYSRGLAMVTNEARVAETPRMARRWAVTPR